MTACLPMDVVWLVLRCLPCNQIMLQRAVCVAWRQTVDGLSADDWRRLFCVRVCECLSVKEGFDWRYAAVSAALSCRETIAATCTWHNVDVRVRTPWTSGSEGIDAPLRPGISRGKNTPNNAHVIDYIYDDTFRLRAIGRTCIQQFAQECSNCASKRQCLFMRYTYYLRPLQATLTHDLDECLSRRLATHEPVDAQD